MAKITSLYNCVLIGLLWPLFSSAQFTLFKQTFSSEVISHQVDDGGFVWMASRQQVARVLASELQMIDFVSQGFTSPKITGMTTDGQQLLIATSNHGLLYFNPSTNRLTAEEKVPNDTRAVAWSQSITWVVSDGHLHRLGNETAQWPIGFDVVQKIIPYQSGLLLLANQELFFFDGEQFNEWVYYQSPDEKGYIWDLKVTPETGLFMLSEKAIYHATDLASDWNHLAVEVSGAVAMDVQDGVVWLSSTQNGLTQLDWDGKSLIINNNLNTENSDLKANDATSVRLDQNGRVWLGHFDGVVSVTKPQFEATTPDYVFKDSAQCKAMSSYVNDITLANDQSLWLAAKDHFIVTPLNFQTCDEMKPLTGADLTGVRQVPMFSFPGEDNSHWAVYYDLGLVEFDVRDLSVKQRIEGPEETVLINGLVATTEDELFFYSNKGLRSYHLIKKEWQQHVFNDVDDEWQVYDVLTYQPQTSLLGTNQGLWAFKLNGEGKPLIQYLGLKDYAISQLSWGPNGQVWAGSKRGELVVVNTHTWQESMVTADLKLVSESPISNLLMDGSGALWAANDYGLMVIKENSGSWQKNWVGHDLSLDRDAQVLVDDLVVFGGNEGVYVFNSDRYSEVNLSAPIISNVVVHGGEWADGQASQINFSAAQMETLTLDHDDTNLTIGLNHTNFGFSGSEVYSYRLEGLDSSWHRLPELSKDLVFTKLPSGDYTLRFRNNLSFATNQLKIVVHPPFWATWWAWMIYVLLAFASVKLWVLFKTKKSEQLALRLQTEVDAKTQEVMAQKEKVESLLEDKNRFLRQITHEFKTPLSLILGPLENLTHAQEHQGTSGQLKMIDRNANRLVFLVEQLLQLSRASAAIPNAFISQNTQGLVEQVVDSFQPMALSRSIDLILTGNDEATISASAHFVEIVLGNLISNAIKYHDKKGWIQVAAQVEDDDWVLTVKDNGKGLSKGELEWVFEEFKRLPEHIDIEGSGLGLPLVKELVNKNNGTLKAVSPDGSGLEMVIKIPREQVALGSEQTGIDDKYVQSLVEQSRQLIEKEQAMKTSIPASDVMVLVIEDNADLREFIASVLAERFDVRTASDGREGTEMALKLVPDLIVCDVMMPHADGYEVSRAIRNDVKTSHVPLMLLTALSDVQSRMKGWREHVDAYMTKPFSQEELLLKLESMLKIRDILKQKNASISLTEVAEQLPSLDQKFVEKLMEFIESNYQDSVLTRQKIAGAMAMSDRQLSRKTQGLLGKSAMDILRDFRLEKSVELIKQGHQIGIVADLCGFNSISYFSQCFKKGMKVSPTQFKKALQEDQSKD